MWYILLEILVILPVPMSVAVILWQHVKKNHPIDNQTLKFLAIAVLVPIIGLLTLEQMISDSVIAALGGVLIGYMIAQRTEK